MKNFFNIYIYEFFLFFFILLISFSYFLLSPNLILLTLLVFLFFLINFYLIAAFNKNLDDKINSLQSSFLSLINSNIFILNKLKSQFYKNIEVLSLSSSIFFFFYFNKLLFKLYYIKFNTKFIINLLLLNKFYLYLNYTKNFF